MKVIYSQKKRNGLRTKAFTKEVKELFTDTINCYVKEESEKLSVFKQGGVYIGNEENRKEQSESRGDKGRQSEQGRNGIRQLMWHWLRAFLKKIF